LSTELPDRKDEIAAFVETKPTLAQLEEFILTTSLKDNAKTRAELDELRVPPNLKEGVRELKEEGIESFRAGLERAAGPVPVSDFADDLKQIAHL
jgi:hypothetical protein